MVALAESKIVPDKRLIFSISTGRCGTGYLSKLMALVPGVASYHEAPPRFQLVMRHVQSNPHAAYDFWTQRKLPQIEVEKSNIYVETSHLFCKGFVEPLLDCGFKPDIIILSRPHRDVAQSMFYLNTIPGRTAKGLKYYLSPDDPGVLKLPAWEKLSDYQLCYWYCLEIERRALMYRQLFRDLNAKVVSVSLKEIQTIRGFLKIIRGMNLSIPRLRDWYQYFRNQKKKINIKTSSKKNVSLDGDLTRQEKEVFHLIQQ